MRQTAARKTGKIMTRLRASDNKIHLEIANRAISNTLASH